MVSWTEGKRLMRLHDSLACMSAHGESQAVALCAACLPNSLCVTVPPLPPPSPPPPQHTHTIHLQAFHQIVHSWFSRKFASGWCVAVVLLLLKHVSQQAAARTHWTCCPGATCSAGLTFFAPAWPVQPTPCPCVTSTTPLLLLQCHPAAYRHNLLRNVPFPGGF